MCLCACAHLANSFFTFLFPADRPPRTSRLLSCLRSVGRPPPPCLVAIATMLCEPLRYTGMPVIPASDRTISAQTSFRLVTWRSKNVHSTREMVVLFLQTQRHSSCLSIGSRAAVV